MVDKIHAVNRTKIHGPVGQLDEATIASLNDSIALFTGLSD